MSCQKGGKPKNFHYFENLPPLAAMKNFAFSKTEKEQAKNVEKFNQINSDFRKPATDENKKLEQQKFDTYLTIQKAYMEVYPKPHPHQRMFIRRYGLAPKGEASDEFINYSSSATKDNATRCTITYPLIRLVNIPENQDKDKRLSCPCYDITNAAFTEGKNDLAEQVWNKMDFPDAWLGDNYFFYLHKFGETYQKIHDDGPIADAVIHNFNQNERFFTFENRRDLTIKINAKTGVDYSGYANDDYICLRTDSRFDEGTVLHEGTHNTDGGNFCNTDLYKFVSTLMYAHPKVSDERAYAVKNTLKHYDLSQFEAETLARIPEQYYSSDNFKNDPLIDATNKIFSVYGHAKLGKKGAILERINRCMRLRLSGKVGYEKMSQITDLRLDYFKQVDKAENAEDGEVAALTRSDKKQLRKSKRQLRREYRSLFNGLFNSHKSVENEVINCIQAELKHIEKIDKHPLAGDIVLNLDTVARDNICEEEPLEVMIAKTYESAEKISSLRAKKYSEQQLIEEAKKSMSLGNKVIEELEKDKKEGLPLNRSAFCVAIQQAVASETYIHELSSRYYSCPYLYNPIDKYIPLQDRNGNILQENATLLNNVLDNIELLNSPNPETKISPDVCGSDSIKQSIQKGEDMYKEYSTLLSTEKRVDYINDSLHNVYIFNQYHVQKTISSWCFLQHVYKELNPNAKQIPQDLRLSNIREDDGSWTATGEKYAQKFVEQLKQRDMQTNKNLNREDSSQSL